MDIPINSNNGTLQLTFNESKVPLFLREMASLECNIFSERPDSGVISEVEMSIVGSHQDEIEWRTGPEDRLLL
jgi:hypothetical protein